MKLCKDCKHFSPYDTGRCYRPEKFTSPVYGLVVSVHAKRAPDERASIYRCGPNGDYWEEKWTLKKFLRRLFKYDSIHK